MMIKAKRKRAAKSKTAKDKQSKGELPNPSHKRDFDRVLDDAIGVKKK